MKYYPVHYVVIDLDTLKKLTKGKRYIEAGNNDEAVDIVTSQLMAEYRHLNVDIDVC